MLKIRWRFILSVVLESAFLQLMIIAYTAITGFFTVVWDGSFSVLIIYGYALGLASGKDEKP